MDQAETPSTGLPPDEYFFSLIRDILSDWESARINPTRAKLAEELVRLTEIAPEEADRYIGLYNQLKHSAKPAAEAWLDEFRGELAADRVRISYAALHGRLVYETGMSPSDADWQLQAYIRKNGLALKPGAWRAWLTAICVTAMLSSLFVNASAAGPPLNFVSTALFIAAMMGLTFIINAPPHSVRGAPRGYRRFMNIYWSQALLATLFFTAKKRLLLLWPIL